MPVLLIFIAFLTVNSPVVAGNWNTSDGSAIATAGIESGFDKFKKSQVGYKTHNYGVMADKSKAKAGVKYQRLELRASGYFRSLDRHLLLLRFCQQKIG